MSGNNHRLQKFSNKIAWRFGDDKEKLTSDSGVSHAQSFVSARPSESERHGRNIYVTKHFEQHIEDTSRPTDNEEEVPAVKFWPHKNGQ